MRIIAGEFRGRTLKAPKGTNTRPTTDRVRESMMSMIASARGGFDGAVVLDAFAGSGALGLEALSRGARCAHFFERDGATLRVLDNNVAALGLRVGEPTAQVRLQRSDVLASPPLRPQTPFNLVFLDPPYAQEATDVLGLIASLHEHGALEAGALVVYEHAGATAASVDEAAATCGLRLAQRKKYGDTMVDLFEIAQSE